MTVFYHLQSCKVAQRQPKSDIIQKWTLDRTPVTIFVHFANFPGEIKMKQIKGIHLLSHKKIPKNCQIMHLLTFMARIYSHGHTYLQERLGTVAFIKFSCIEGRKGPQILGRPSSLCAAMIYGYCSIVLNSRQLEATEDLSDNLWYVHTMKYYVTIKRKELCKYRCKDL